MALAFDNFNFNDPFSLFESVLGGRRPYTICIVDDDGSDCVPVNKGQVTEATGAVGGKQPKPICKPNRSKQICALNDRYGDLPPVRNVITAGNRTIVFFDDGTKTSVQCRKGDTYSAEAGLAFALLKRILGKQTSRGPEVRGNGYDRILSDIAAMAKGQEKKRIEAKAREKAEKAAIKAAAGAKDNDQQ